MFSPVEFINTGTQANSNTMETGIQTSTEIVSTTTVLPIPPMDVPVVPNLELITKVDQGTQTIIFLETQVQIVEKTVNVMDLVNAGRLDQLNNVL
jgi:hypothetical protein